MKRAKKTKRKEQVAPKSDGKSNPELPPTCLNNVSKMRRCTCPIPYTYLKLARAALFCEFPLPAQSEIQLNYRSSSMNGAHDEPYY
jgi:hypothetical protein